MGETFGFLFWLQSHFNLTEFSQAAIIIHVATVQLCAVEKTPTHLAPFPYLVSLVCSQELETDYYWIIIDLSKKSVIRKNNSHPSEFSPNDNNNSHLSMNPLLQWNCHGGRGGFTQPIKTCTSTVTPTSCSSSIYLLERLNPPKPQPAPIERGLFRCGEKGTLLHCWWECKLM